LRMTVPVILLVENAPEDAYLILRRLNEYFTEPHKLLRATTLSEAEECLSLPDHGICLILLDLGLPDSASPHDTFERMKKYASDIPIVILTGMSDHTLALKLISEGADDFINKSLLHDKPELMKNAVEFAIHRRAHRRATG
jgi:FixJ family two-component response regulator